MRADRLRWLRPELIGLAVAAAYASAYLVYRGLHRRSPHWDPAARRIVHVDLARPGQRLAWTCFRPLFWLDHRCAGTTVAVVDSDSPAGAHGRLYPGVVTFWRGR